ncbi:uncharacterized protein LOC111615966 [Centruroides sculpturatus]|uniref:uncharacterized protein LOC111615966 n=1 Tax=Centruroides sculpturatus TaxID=218467 RepID=UPI000C6EB114|nr:uncharacterized protein LOC111615966 [Centruroides sculpturatus]
MNSFNVISGVELLENDDLLVEMSNLFSTNYGIWSNKGLHPGQPIKMSVKLMKKMLLFNSEKCGAAIAKSMCESSKLIGHAFYYEFSTKNLGKVCWITQLVTSQLVRHKRIATRLISTILNNGDYNVCGLVTSHPYAIRALERATSSICDRKVIEKYASEVIENCCLPYMEQNAVIDSHGSINTNYHVDHTELLKIIQEERDASRWVFGELLDGFEFLVFVFTN